MLKSCLYIEPQKTFKELINNSNATSLGKPTIKLEFETNEELVNFQERINNLQSDLEPVNFDKKRGFYKDELNGIEETKEKFFKLIDSNPQYINLKKDANNYYNNLTYFKTDSNGIKKRAYKFISPIEDIFCWSNFEHIIYTNSNRQNRTNILPLIKPTIENPNLIINCEGENYYIKPFITDKNENILFSFIPTLVNNSNLKTLFTPKRNYLYNKFFDKDGKKKQTAVLLYHNDILDASSIFNGTEPQGAPFKIVELRLFVIDTQNNKKGLNAPNDLYIISDTRLKSKKDLDEIKALQKYNIQPFKPEEYATDTGVKLVLLKNIKKDTKRFQNRENAESSESVNRIINAVKKGDFNWAAFDPVVLWKDPKDGNIYVLSGHSRTRAFEILSEQGATVNGKNFNRIPAKFFEGSEQDAINFALNSNTLSTKETDVERAKYYRRLIGTMPEYKLKELTEQNEGKNANRILAYAHLRPGSYTLNALTRLQDSSTENAELVKTVADWIGRLFIQFPQLTLEHDKEIFNWLMLEGHYGVGAGKINNYQKLLDVIRLAVFRLQGKDGFESEKRLNLSNVGGESDSMKNYNEKLKQLNNEIKNANAALKAKRKEFLQRQKADNTITRADIERALKPYNDNIINLQKQIIDLNANKSKYLDADKRQKSLFGISREANIWNTTKLDCKGFKPTYKKLNSYDSFFNTSKNLDELAGYGINDTIYLIKDCVKKNYKSCKAIAQHLKANTIPQSIFNLWYWLHENIKYNYDAQGKEQLRTPERVWADRERGVDCDCLSIFAYCTLLCMNLKPVFEIAKFNGKNQYSHIYVVCNNIVLDRVWPTFNEKAPFITEVKQFSVKMPTYLENLAGLF